MAARKRWRSVEAKPGELKAAYGRCAYSGDLDLWYAWGAGGACKADSRVLSTALEGVAVYEGKTLREVLEERGYDITTLKFSIQKKSAARADVDPASRVRE